MTSSPFDRRRPGFSRPARLRALAPAWLVLALLAATGALGACKDTTGVRAIYRTAVDTLTVYALSDTAIARRDYPTGLITGVRGSNAEGNIAATPVVVPVGAYDQFDVAFDIDASGKVVLYPQRRILSGVAGRRVGLQVVDGTFDALTEAPARGYQYDSVAVTVDTGDVVVVQAQTSQCIYEFSPYNYSKIVVDSVVPAIQAIYFRIASDPNCGFRSFVPNVVPTR